MAGTKKNAFPRVIIIVAIPLLAFAAGWFAKAVLDSSATPSLPIRLTGYQFISPLLSCNSGKSFPESVNLNNDLQAVITRHEQAGDITKASTYFADFSTGRRSQTNSQETYYPSSITKIPIMMAYYDLAESSSAVLDQEITYPASSTDLNNSQEIQPETPLVPGQSYSAEELIERMIKYSDNNAAALLYESIDHDTLQDVYNDLQIPIDDGPITPGNLDFITPQEISILFRVLYNATYLSRDDSEKALRLLSESTFTQGLVAGVPSSTMVAHKFGIVAITTNGIETERELHDCGIVYASNHPYVLCVMTRGPATDAGSLQAMENTISDISQTVYRDVENGKE